MWVSSHSVVTSGSTGMGALSRGGRGPPTMRIPAGSENPKPAPRPESSDRLRNPRRSARPGRPGGSTRPEPGRPMKAVVFDRFGEPNEVLSVREVPTPEPGPGQVRVRMVASPVNPSDLLVVRGRYGVLPQLPSTPGFEGVGIVDKAGPGLLGWFAKGKRVTVINGAGGNWAEYAVIPAKQARPVPSDLPDEQVASFFVNPATVLAMVRHVLKVPKGAWLLQSAAGSTLGKMIIKLGKVDGFKTLNVVRRREAIDELKALGGD